MNSIQPVDNWQILKASRKRLKVPLAMLSILLFSLQKELRWVILSVTVENLIYPKKRSNLTEKFNKGSINDSRLPIHNKPYTILKIKYISEMSYYISVCF